MVLAQASLAFDEVVHLLEAERERQVHTEEAGQARSCVEDAGKSSSWDRLC